MKNSSKACCNADMLKIAHACLVIIIVIAIENANEENAVIKAPKALKEEMVRRE
jgi:hypothetical protein